jgi:hypothetical protein
MVGWTLIFDLLILLMGSIASFFRRKAEVSEKKFLMGLRWD